MLRIITRMFVAVLLAVVGVGIVFVVGMRRSRRRPRCGPAGEPLMKPLVLNSAGTPGASASVIRHVGRATGRPFETPVGAVATEDGFVIALPYGSNTDWLKNVLASGSAVIVDDGATYDVDRPEVVPLQVEALSFSPGDKRSPHVRVEDCLRCDGSRPT